MNQPTHLPLLPGGASFGSYFLGFAGSIAGLTLVSLIGGYIEARDYFAALGAPWAISMLSPVRIVQIGGVLVGLIAMFVLCGLILRSIVQPEKYPLLFFVLMVAGIFIWMVLTIAALHFLPTYPTILLEVHRFTPYVTVATAGSAIITVLENPIVGRHPALFFLAGVVVLGIFVGVVGSAASRGKYQGLRDSNPSEKRFSAVSSPKLGDSWLLVSPLDSGFLLMTPALERGNRKFRVVGVDEGFDVHPPK